MNSKAATTLEADFRSQYSRDFYQQGFDVSYPHFVAVDASSWEEDAHPIAIAWSMTDGQIKTTLIQPDDGWDDWDYALEDIHGISRDTLYQRGETTWSVIRELENDLEQSYLFADDQERVEELLNRIYESCGRELSLEVGSHSENIQNRSALAEATEQLFHQHLPCDERVLVMLQLWVSEHGYQTPADEAESRSDDNDDRDDNDESDND